MKCTWVTGVAILAVQLHTAPVAAQSLSRELAAEGSASLAKAARARGSAVRGAILFPQKKINCAACHASGGRNPLGPDLTRMDEKVTDAYLVESILQPSKVIKKGFESVIVTTAAGKILTGRIVKQSPNELVLREAADKGRLITLAKSDVDRIIPNKKSTMPDGVVDQLTGRQQFLDLVRYMMEIAAAGNSADSKQFEHSLGGGTLSAELQGLVLLDEFNCLACHDHKSANNKIPPKRAPDLTWAGGRINPSYITRYIADPNRVKPGTTMPDVMGGLKTDARRGAAAAITHYLVSLGTKTFELQPIDSKAAGRGRELFHSVGCVACHSPRGADGSELLAGTSAALGALHEKYNVDGLVALLKNPHAVRPSGRMPNMQLTHWEAIDIAHYLLNDAKADRQSSRPFKLDRTLADKGKQHFTELGCVRCHGKDDARVRRDSPLSARVRIDRGCLSAEAGDWPRYRLDDSQRKAILSALKREPRELTDQQQIAVTLTTFKCTACHQRGDLGGVPPERDDYFHTANPNLGPQGRIPPPLTAVGAKLKPKWMREVLVSGRTIRPYMKTRMPQYGAENVAHLIELLQRTDQSPGVQFARFRDQKEIKKTGAEMAGSSGLNCVACHTFQQKPSQTMPAVDLTEMAERLQKNWFYRYLRAPQRLSRNTVMPTFWPGGRAIRKDILDGDPDLQIEALWQYLLDGRQARTPRGLIREPMELLAGDEAVMLRRNYSGIGKRGIGVGYPNQVNLAFDAEQMRIGMIWKGKFADPGGVWRGQGSGTVRPLGSDLIRFARGPELDDATDPWVVDDGRPPRHQFKGYSLDRLRRPVFNYRFENIDVTDYPIDVKDGKSGKTLIRRTLTFTSQRERGNLSFRAAAGDNIVKQDDGAFLIGETLLIRIDKKHTGKIVKTLTGKQLRIPLEVTDKKSTLVLEYAW